ncbi:MAG: ChaN family lipoprotein [Burkholderiales bacterium]|nr:ChaN family lipoprotein [Burkholderiales bacterium]
MNPKTATLLAATLLVSAAPAHAQMPHGHPAPARACLAPAAWYTLAGGQAQASSGPVLLEAMARRDVVLLGEQHDDADHHRWQLQTLAALHLQKRPMIIGFESFPRRVQPVLDKWVAGELTVKQFLEQSGWDKVWRFPSELYVPLFQFARINRIPMIALNIEQSLTAAITKTGWDTVPPEQKEGVSRPAPASDAYTEFLYKTFQQHPRVADKGARAPDKNSNEFRFFVESQTTWDRAMAEALASRVGPGQGAQRPLVVGIMGGGHVRHGYGVPHQLRDLGISNIGTLLPVDADQDCDELKPGLAHAVFALPATPADKPPPPRLGVQLELADKSVKLLNVTPGSLAEKTGLRIGDQIISIAGTPVTKIISVVAAVRLQPAGTWLPIEVRRGTETREYVIKFPPQK